MNTRIITNNPTTTNSTKQPERSTFPKRGARFPLSLGERAGVRAGSFIPTFHSPALILSRLTISLVLCLAAFTPFFRPRGRHAGNPHAVRAAHTAHQWRGHFWRAAGPSISLPPPHHRRPPHGIFRRQAPRRPHARRRQGKHHRRASQKRRLQGRLPRQKLPRHQRQEFQD